MELITIILSHKCLLSAGRDLGYTWVPAGLGGAQRGGTSGAHEGADRLGSAWAGVKTPLLCAAVGSQQCGVSSPPWAMRLGMLV